MARGPGASRSGGAGLTPGSRARPPQSEILATIRMPEGAPAAVDGHERNGGAPGRARPDWATVRRPGATSWLRSADGRPWRPREGGGRGRFQHRHGLARSLAAVLEQGLKEAERAARRRSGRDRARPGEAARLGRIPGCKPLQHRAIIRTWEPSVAAVFPPWHRHDEQPGARQSLAHDPQASEVLQRHLGGGLRVDARLQDARLEPAQHRRVLRSSGGPCAPGRPATAQRVRGHAAAGMSRPLRPGGEPVGADRSGQRGGASADGEAVALSIRSALETAAGRTASWRAYASISSRTSGG